MTVLGASRRHALQSVPGMVLPGMASGLGLIAIGHLSGASTLGTLSVAWATANMGAALLALGPAHAALYELRGEPADLPAYRAILARRTALVVPVAVAGAVLEAAGAGLGRPLTTGALWAAAQSLVLFESEVLRAGGGFRRASALLAARSLVGWSASVAVALLGAGAVGIAAAQAATTLALWVGSTAAPRLCAPSPALRARTRQLAGPISRLGAAAAVLGYADRYVVLAILGEGAVGTYTLAYTLGQGAAELIGTPLTQALVPRVVIEEAGGTKGVAAATIRRALPPLLLTGLVAGPAVWAADVTGVLALVSTDPALAPVTVVVAMATAVQLVNRLLYALLLGQGRPERAWRSFLLAVVVSAAVVPVLTWALGITGTAVATLVGYSFLAALLDRAARS